MIAEFMDTLGQIGFDFKLAGRRIRERRQLMALTAQELANIAGISRQTLVRIEGGHPCKWETLDRIRRALLLFHDCMQRPDPPVDFCATHAPDEAHWTAAYRKSRYQKHGSIEDPIHINDETDRQRLGELGFQPFFTSVFNSELPGGVMNQALMEIHQSTWMDQHPGEEFVYCLRGKVKVMVRDEEFILDPGGALTFWAMEPHRYISLEPGPDGKPVLLLIVLAITPQEGRKVLKLRQGSSSANKP